MLVVMELLSWLFSLLLGARAFKYLLMQRYFVLFRLIFIRVSGDLVLAVFLVKIGIPPFHLWLIPVLINLKKINFRFFNHFP